MGPVENLLLELVVQPIQVAVEVLQIVQTAALAAPESSSFATQSDNHPERKQTWHRKTHTQQRLATVV